MTTKVEPASSVSHWSIDQAHSSVHFKVRHMMISWVRGNFHTVKGTLDFDDQDPTRSRVEIDIDAASIATRDEQRDQHLRSADFLDVEKFPTIRFVSTAVVEEGQELIVRGDLTIHGTTRPVELKTESISPPTKDPWGNERIATSATTSINRKDYGLAWNAALEAGGVLVGDEVVIDLDVEFVKAAQK